MPTSDERIAILKEILRFNDNGRMPAMRSSRPQFCLWHLFALITVVCAMCAFPILHSPPVLVVAVTSAVSGCAVWLLTKRQLMVVMWTAATIVVAFAVVIGLQVIWLNERHDYLRKPRGGGILWHLQY